MHEGNSSLKSIMACVENSIREKAAEEFGKGFHSKVKLDLYRRFGGKREYLHAVVMRELDSCLSSDQEHMV